MKDEPFPDFSKSPQSAAKRRPRKISRAWKMFLRLLDLATYIMKPFFMRKAKKVMCDFCNKQLNKDNRNIA